MRISDWSSDVCSSDLRRLQWHRNRRTIGGGLGVVAMRDTRVGCVGELGFEFGRRHRAELRETVQILLADALLGDQLVFAVVAAGTCLRLIGGRNESGVQLQRGQTFGLDRKSTRLNSSH